MKLLIGNIKTQIEYSETPEFQNYFNKIIHESMDPLDPNRYNIAAFVKWHKWDGRREVTDLKNHIIPTGLLPQLIRLIKAEQVVTPELTLELEDTRTEPVKLSQPLPEKVELHDDKLGSIVLRDYQRESVIQAFDKQRITLALSTGAGKTESASTIIKYGLPEIKDDERILFLVGSKNIAHQSQERISQRIEHEVGFWGDGKKDIKQITVGMSGTLASALKDPEKDIKLTSQKDKVLKHFAQDYAPQFVNKPNIKQTIRAYLKNNPPKYSYDEEIQTTLASWVSDPQVSQKELSDALWWQVNAFHDLLRKKNQKAYDKYEEAVNFLESVKIVVGDEQQHSVSESYTLIYDHLINARMNIGLTGTPPKGDPVKEQKFKAIMGEEIYRVSNDELITRGVSAKPTIQMVPVTEPKDLDAEIVLQMPQDTPEKQQGLMSYQLAYQLGVVNNEVRNKTIASIVKKLTDSKSGSTLIVVNSVEHGEIIKGYLDEMGIDTYFMQGSSSTEERNDMINKAKTGKLDVLIGTQVVDEGLDIPSLKYLIYASAGKSSRQLLQRIGRMLRKSDTKNTTVIFDIEDRTADILFKQAKTRIRLYKSEKFTVNEV